MKKSVSIIFILMLSGCATLVNDAMIPINFSFSDGSNGECVLTNKRGVWSPTIPSTVMVRRSDDSLIYNCETDDGRESVGSLQSEIEAEKIGASVLFLDLGITDAITDKHRDYQRTFVIPVRKSE